MYQTEQLEYGKKDRFRELIESLNVITYEFDLTERRFIYVSRMAEMILGYSSGEWKSKGFWISHLHPEDRDWASEFSRFQVSRLQDHEFEYRMISKDGSVKWFKDITTVNSGGTESKTLQGVLIDITEKKETEIQLLKDNNSEQQLQLIFESAPIGMAITDFKGNFVRVNKAYCDIVGYSKEELLDLAFSDITHPDDKDINEEILREGRNGEISNIHFEKRYVNKLGKIINVDLHLSVMKNSAGQAYQQIAQVVDITKRKESDQKLKLTQARLSAVLNNLPNVALYEYGKNVNFVSENIMDILGYSAEEFMDNERLFSNLMLGEDVIIYDKVVADWKKAGAKGVVSNEFRVINKNSEIVWIEDHMFEITPESGDPYFSGIMIDITEQKKVQQRIQDTETKLAVILKNLPKVVVYQSGKDRDFISENILEMTGYSSEEILKEKFFFGSKMHPDDLKIVLLSLKKWHKKNDEGILIMEFRLKKKNDECIWIEDHMFRVKTAGGESYLSGVLIDVTERKLSEEKISRSLREKELLLKEIHHRVKNNLQVVSSLLKLQSGSIKDNHLLDHSHNILIDSQNRVRSMALVHQKLYQSKDFSRIDFSEYLKQLSDQLYNAFKSSSNDVKIDILAEKVNLSIDLAIPCGLIINELISNSLKYAFPNGQGGKIELRIQTSESGEVMIAVCDNGIGFPKNIDYKNTQSLGLQLVNTLIGQIDGTITKHNHEGTKFEIKFLNKASKKRT